MIRDKNSQFIVGKFNFHPIHVTIEKKLIKELKILNRRIQDYCSIRSCFRKPKLIHICH